jgi:large conductance mechanosensitive channel
MKDFLTFIRERGVVGLAVGFVLGGAASKLVTAIVDDVANPLIGLMLGRASGLQDMVLKIGKSEVAWGHLLSAVIDFVVIALVVYLVVNKLGLEKLDKKKDSK